MLFLRRYTLKRIYVHASDQKTADGADDLEKGSGGNGAEVEGNEAAIPVSNDDKTIGKSATSSDE